MDYLKKKNTHFCSSKAATELNGTLLEEARRKLELQSTDSTTRCVISQYKHYYHKQRERLNQVTLDQGNHCRRRNARHYFLMSGKKFVSDLH